MNDIKSYQPQVAPNVVGRAPIPPPRQPASNPWSEPSPLSRLEFNDFMMAKSLFVEVFDSLFIELADKATRDVLIDHLGRLKSDFALHRLFLPVTVTILNEQIFTDPKLTNFHLELLERFSLAIVSISEQVFARFSQQIVEALAASKADLRERVDKLEQPLTSISIDRPAALLLCQKNPWLITIALFITEFKKTKVGVFNALPDPS